MDVIVGQTVFCGGCGEEMETAQHYDRDQLVTHHFARCIDDADVLCKREGIWVRLPKLEVQLATEEERELWGL